MFIVGPPTSASPRPPDVVKLTSCELRDVGQIARHAAAAERRADGEAIDLQTALGASPAGAAEDDEARAAPARRAIRR